MADDVKLDIPVLGEPKTPETPEPQPTPELSPRARAEREVWAAANIRRAREAAEPLPPVEGQEAPAEHVAKPDEAPPADAPADKEPPAPKVDDAPTDDPEVELIVNGQPQKFKQSQITEAGRRTLSKDAAADMKLEIASRLLREAEERVGKQPSAPVDAQPPADPSKTPVKVKSDADLAELLQYGTKEQAADAIAEIRRRDASTVDQQGLQDFIAKQLPAALDARITFHEAVRTARSEYSDIFADPHLSTLFYVQENRARETGDARPHAELYKEIGDGIRKHFKLPGKTQAAGPTLADKKELKAKMPSLPQSAAARVEDKGGEKPLTPEAARERALAAMRKSRGQDQGIRKY